MAKFFQGFSRQAFVVVLLKYLVWTGINFALLYWARYLDNERNVSEALLTILMIPLGLVNCGVLVDSVRSMRHFHWRTFVYFVVGAGNFILYVAISLQMYSQSGVILN